MNIPNRNLGTEIRSVDPISYPVINVSPVV